MLILILQGRVSEEDEEEDSPYWEPAEVEEELYLQLDHIRVKRIPNDELEYVSLHCVYTNHYMFSLTMTAG